MRLSVSSAPLCQAHFYPRILRVPPRILYPRYLHSHDLETQSSSNGGSRATAVETANGSNSERERVFSAYRQWGYLEGDLDPLGFLRPRETPELAHEGEYAREARAIYS